MPKAKVKAALRDLRENPEKGKPLGGALAGCRSIRLAGENRLVYRVNEGGDSIEVIAIGRRRAEAVYNEAEKRVSE